MKLIFVRKIDIYIDKEGNLFYRTDKGSHYEPIYENMKTYGQ